MSKKCLLSWFFTAILEFWDQSENPKDQPINNLKVSAPTESTGYRLHCTIRLFHNYQWSILSWQKGKLQKKRYKRNKNRWARYVIYDALTEALTLCLKYPYTNDGLFPHGKSERSKCPKCLELPKASLITK